MSVKRPFPTTQPSPDAEFKDPLRERKDLASKATGFLSWLWDRRAEAKNSEDESAEFHRLWEIYLENEASFSSAHYSFKRWSTVITEVYPDESAELLTLLLRAEAEWKAESLALGKARTALEIVSASRVNRDFHIPQEDVLCGFVHRSGKTCKNYVVPGSPRCIQHGGALIDPEARRSILISAYISIVEKAELAVDTLAWVAEHGRNELARVQASKEILDRAGLTPELNVNINLKTEDSVSQVLKDRIAKITEHLESTTIDADSVDVIKPIPNSELPFHP